MSNEQIVMNEVVRCKRESVYRGMRQLSLAFLPPVTNLGQGYIFTGVCDSVHGGGGGSGGACSVGGACFGGGSGPGGEGSGLLNSVTSPMRTPPTKPSGQKVLEVEVSHP